MYELLTILVDEEPSLDVPIDPATWTWLEKVARMTGQTPADVAASLLHDIRVDDEKTHETFH